jgi:hypothetical protein
MTTTLKFIIGALAVVRAKTILEELFVKLNTERE